MSALLVVASFTLLIRFIPLIDVHDPWIDEAMLAANFPLAAVSGIFEPLPYFEQAAPLGYTALLNLIALSFPDDALFPFRVLSVIASLIAAGLIFDAVRRFAAWPVVVLTLAFACLTPFIVRYSLEIKPYIFEYLATAFVMHASTYFLAGANAYRFGYFLGASVFAIVFSFTAPIVIGAFGIGIITHHFFYYAGEARIKKLRGVIGMLSLTAVIFLINYFGYTRPVTAIQFASWSFFYNDFYLSFPPMDGSALYLWLKLPKFIISQFDLFPQSFYNSFQSIPLKGIIYAVYIPIFIVGIISLFRLSTFFAAAVLCATFMILGLSILGLLPIVLVRHFAFLVPMISLVLAFGLISCLNWCLGWASPQHKLKLVSACVFLAVLMVGLSGYRKAVNIEVQAVSPLIAHITESNEVEAPVWVYYGAQPAMRIMAPKSLVQIGLVEHKSSTPSWITAQRDSLNSMANERYFKQYRDIFRNYSKVWLVFSHMRAERNHNKFEEIAEEMRAECREVKTATNSSLWWCDRTQPSKSATQ